jgi:rubrerythrin
MAFFDDVKKLGKSVAEKGKDAIEITKLNSQISGEKDKMKDMFAKIGEQVFANFKMGNDQGFGEWCTQLQEAEGRIAELQQKVLEIKNASKCPSCGAEISNETAFCPKCGAKVN